MTDRNHELIALVNEQDEVIGYDKKQKVHEKGLLHRAFSIFIFNKKNEMLLQKRASHKYHSPSLWTNTCCSHLLPNKTMEQCAHDRLIFEMGFDTSIEMKFSFHYLAPFDNGLTENEIDHVFLGTFNKEPKVNPDEVETHRWITMKDLLKDINSNPDSYTFWFKHIIENYHEKIAAQ